jgi:hypothetical protein
LEDSVKVVEEAIQIPKPVNLKALTYHPTDNSLNKLIDKLDYTGAEVLWFDDLRRFIRRRICSMTSTLGDKSGSSKSSTMAFPSDYRFLEDQRENGRKKEFAIANICVSMLRVFIDFKARLTEN